jgi:hypothetical protein
MPNDYTDPVEDAIRRAGASGKKGSRKVSYVGMLEGIFKAATTPFRFPSEERMKKFVDNNKRAREYWYERNEPGYLPPGHPDRRK